MALLPDTATDESGAISVAMTPTQPNKTYKMMIDTDRIQGTITDDLEAVKQAIYKIINTERYKFLIYSWNYGIELEDLFGKPIPYVLPEIPRRIKEALTQDDRIKDVLGFDLTYNRKGDVLAKFTVVTIYGNLEIEKVVNVA
uniref:DUF2634 domain-containing protein n=1 Tax=Siphoviridae sp. ctoRD1 TaxID=2825669 RepID=A0A8S5QFY8_9CAUD|nr:MAG TPA: Protein of unknown function (DUF2634) [Siphoviridae sp. ctoRD1]